MVSVLSPCGRVVRYTRAQRTVKTDNKRKPIALTRDAKTQARSFKLLDNCASTLLGSFYGASTTMLLLALALHAHSH